MNAVVRHTHAQVSRHGAVRRRDFLRAIPAAAGAAGLLSWPDLLSLRADELRKQGKACILLWMQGGPSQFETFSPKPGHANGGETKAISTSVPGIQIAENLPRTAEVMDRMCLIRSMTSTEGSHPRGTQLMHTGYTPTASVKYPSLGANVAHQIGDLKNDLPGFVRIGNLRSSDGGGILGVDYNPFLVNDPNRKPDNTQLPTSQERYQRRLQLLGRLENFYAEHGGKQEASDHEKLVDRTARMLLSPKMQAFDLEREPSSMRQAYGRSSFGSGCLLARRLVEAGVTFVEVVLGNWDTHQDNFARSRRLCQQLDQPLAQLIRDLEQRGRLDSTLIIWMGEFGRTPRVNANSGRDHYPRAFDVALAGAGVKGGQVIGSTDSSGSTVRDRPVKVTDLFRTFCLGLGIDPDVENLSSIGRPIKVVDTGNAVREVFA